MNYNVETISSFRKEAKHLIKKYPSLKKEIENLGSLLSVNPKLGTPVGKNCYKIRLAIKSKGTGKSGGARVITHLYIEKNTVYLLSIYDKSESESITDANLSERLKEIDG